MDGQYNNPYDYNPAELPQKKIMWASVTCFVLSLVNIVCCCCATYILAPLSIVFGIVSLAKKWAGKGLAVAGTIISSVTLVAMIIMSIFMNNAFREPYMDMVKFSMNPDKYIEEYQETGEVPEDFRKYCDPKYDKFWEMTQYDGFEEFFDEYIQGFMSTYKRYSKSDDDKDNKNNDKSNSEREKFFDDYGENPVDL